MPAIECWKLKNPQPFKKEIRAPSAPNKAKNMITIIIKTFLG